MLAWIGGSFDPEYFRPEEVRFDDPEERWRIAFGGEMESMLDAEHGLTADEERFHRLVDWIQQDTGEHAAQAEALPLRRDMVTVLTYVRDHRVIGTQSTGNFPLKAVREMTARFVHPPPLETTTGDRTYRIRSAADVWPLYFLHILAQVGELLEGGPARRWRLTSFGEMFLTTPPLVQV